MNASPKEVEYIHRLYCCLTGQDGLPLRFDRQRWWSEWIQCGFTEIDLKVVVRYIKQGIHSGKRNQGALKFSNLICQVDRFEEELFETRRVLNARPARPKYVTETQTIGDMQRQVEVEANTDPIDVSEILRKYLRHRKK